MGIRGFLENGAFFCETQYWQGNMPVGYSFLIGGRLFILTTFLNLASQREGEILRSEAALGKVQIRSSAVKCSNFEKFQFFFEFPFFLCSRT